ncbi:conserved hypothetical protein [Paecilomyces variotii No. 5]|uniref:Uncharacterized protein n=1 Tax=Byssochlamys spectabilis (strain No. 5 / NBRC 109023) TaxID=1356009 RepID=V5FST3_BYSSN|nr:conserved hypothetical protein [Paecilomyces variotii No. 5]
MERVQYLLLRVLWRENHAGDLDPHRYGLSDFLEEAKEKLQDYNGWKEYYRHTHLPDQETIPNLMTFSTPRFYQLLIKRSIKDDDESIAGNEDVIFSPIQTRAQRRQAERAASPTDQTTRQMRALQLETPTKSKPTDTETDLFGEVSPVDTQPSIGISPIPREAEGALYPATKDEQIVNMALVLLLNALTIHLPLLNDWTPGRRKFTVTLGSRFFRAYTDGCLEDRKQDRVRALIEVKPYIRKNRVRMQEAAQMVGWISDENQRPSGYPGRCFHISQNRQFVYIIFAEYDDNYIEYLKDGTVTDGSFLTMHEFGPWDVFDPRHMKEFGTIVLALTLRTHHDQQVEGQSRGSHSRGKPNKGIFD